MFMADGSPAVKCFLSVSYDVNSVMLEYEEIGEKCRYLSTPAVKCLWVMDPQL